LQYLDAHATAVGKVLLAFSTDHEVQALYRDEPLRRHTPKTIHSAPVLLRELAAVKRTGFATENSELVVGLSAMAVLIYNPVGQVNLAVWLHQKNMPALMRGASLRRCSGRSSTSSAS
jgi:DNA-binding IclR family transcriptional regulator